VRRTMGMDARPAPILPALDEARPHRVERHIAQCRDNKLHCHHLRAAQLPAQRDLSGTVDPMNLKDVLRDIKT
jgi:hypothetical protein